MPRIRRVTRRARRTETSLPRRRISDDRPMTATGQAEAEAQDAWESIQAALKDLETRIRGAVDDL